MIIRAIWAAQDTRVPAAPPDGFGQDEEYRSSTDLRRVPQSLRFGRASASADERDAEDERIVALMLTGDPFD
jgi:hypothetical protein